MEKRYVNADRYKKVPRNSSRKRTVKKRVSANNLKNKKIQKKKSNKKTYSVNKGKFVRFIFCLFVILLIAIISRIVTRKDNEPFIPIFSNNQVKENTDSINIAIYDNTDISTNNVIITELEQYIYPMLLRINSDYNIKYEVLSNVNKINNREYELEIDNSMEITAVDVKDTIDKIISEKNKYYYKVENVDKVEVKSKNNVYISLKLEDPYFIYNLNIPIYEESNENSIYSIDKSSNETNLKLVRKDSADIEYIKYINVIKVESEEKAIELYKENKIDIFFSSSNNITKMLGKYEYDLKAYNSGESVFLMFNPLSALSKEKYIRQIIAYSIDREKIIKDVSDNNGSVIDLPYIYDDEKYKYDVYAADNLLLSNGYVKNNLYYTKSYKKLSLTLLVNKDDNEKVSVANRIKEDLAKVGVNIIVENLTGNEIQKRMNTSSYDLVLASVYTNDNPNISHLKNNMILTTNVKEKISALEQSDIKNMSNNISNLKNTLSDDIAIYGIYSKNSYIVCRKSINILKNINYMNLLSGYFNEKQ